MIIFKLFHLLLSTYIAFILEILSSFYSLSLIIITTIKISLHISISKIVDKNKWRKWKKGTFLSLFIDHSPCPPYINIDFKVFHLTLTSSLDLFIYKCYCRCCYVAVAMLLLLNYFTQKKIS